MIIIKTFIAPSAGDTMGCGHKLKFLFHWSSFHKFEYCCWQSCIVSVRKRSRNFIVILAINNLFIHDYGWIHQVSTKHM